MTLEWTHVDDDLPDAPVGTAFWIYDPKKGVRMESQHPSWWNTDKLYAEKVTHWILVEVPTEPESCHECGSFGECMCAM